MMGLDKKPRSPCLRLLASGESAKNAADHLGARAGMDQVTKMNLPAPRAQTIVISMLYGYKHGI